LTSHVFDRFSGSIKVQYTTGFIALSFLLSKTKVVLVEASSCLANPPFDCLTHRKTYTLLAVKSLKPLFLMIKITSDMFAGFVSAEEDKEMILKLVSEMPGGFEAMNGYLRRNIAEALRTMQAWRGTNVEWLR
jgi:hypothetical protein